MIRGREPVVQEPAPGRTADTPALAARNVANAPRPPCGVSLIAFPLPSRAGLLFRGFGFLGLVAQPDNSLRTVLGVILRILDIRPLRRASVGVAGDSRRRCCREAYRNGCDPRN